MKTIFFFWVIPDVYFIVRMWGKSVSKIGETAKQVFCGEKCGELRQNKQIKQQYIFHTHYSLQKKLEFELSFTCTIFVFELNMS